jgi:hypothetical protein
MFQVKATRSRQCFLPEHGDRRVRGAKRRQRGVDLPRRPPYGLGVVSILSSDGWPAPAGGSFGRKIARFETLASRDAVYRRQSGRLEARACPIAARPLPYWNCPSASYATGASWLQVNPRKTKGKGLISLDRPESTFPG